MSGLLFVWKFIHTQSHRVPHGLCLHVNTNLYYKLHVLHENFRLYYVVIKKPEDTVERSQSWKVTQLKGHRTEKSQSSIGIFWIFFFRINFVSQKYLMFKRIFLNQLIERLLCETSNFSSWCGKKLNEIEMMTFLKKRY